MRVIVPIGLAVFLASVLGPAGAGAGEPGRWTPEAMLGLRQVGAVQASPDGRRAAFVVVEAVTAGDSSVFRSQIHVVEDGGEAFPLTRGEESSEGPRWSPDGRRIAFLRKASGKSQVWVIHVGGGEAEPLTRAEAGVTGFQWSPDGSRIAYTAVDPLPRERQEKIKAKDDARVVDAWHARSRLHVVDARDRKTDRGEARAVVTGELSVLGGSSPQIDWSPDGKSIVFAHAPTPDADDWTRSDVSIVEVDSGKIRPLARTGRSEGSPFFSPDGGQVAFVASDDPPGWAYDFSVYVAPAGGGEPRKLAETFDHRPELLGWSPDGASLLYRENRGVTTRLFVLPLDGDPRGIGPEDGVVSEPSLNATRTILGFDFQTSEKPAEAYLCRLDHPEAVRVSRVHDDETARPLGRTEVLRWRSSDGKEIEGLLTFPVGYEEGRRAPLLVIVHGGPAGIFTQTYIAAPFAATSGTRQSTSAYPIAAFAASGFAVLRCNVRGGSGYGADFRRANLNDWGGGDFKDVMSGVDEAIARGVADPDRLGLMGWSYGGFMAAWAIGHTDRFKAASVGAAVTDLVSFNGTSDIQSFLPSYFGGEPWDRAEAFREHSPIAHVKGVKTPTLIQHGEDDDRVPIGQGYELYDALKRQGCPVEMVVYPRAHHSIREPKLLLDAMRRNLDWFERHLLDGRGR